MSLNKTNILIVDDNPVNLQILVQFLKKNPEYVVRSFTSPTFALESAIEVPPDLFLLDIAMPEMDGYELCQKIKNTDSLKDIPVVFISALNDAEHIQQGFAVGAVDYVTKPFLFEEVDARLKTHILLRKYIKKTEESLKIAEYNFQTIFNGSPDAIILVNDRGKIELVNDIVVELFGYTREELDEQPIEVLIPERYRHDHIHQRESYQHDPTWRPMQSGLELLGRKKDGTEFYVDISLNPILIENRSHVIASVRDISEMVKARKQIYKLAFYDALTELPNRNLTIKELEKRADINRDGTKPCILYLIDIDDFKRINDTYGYNVGDQVLMIIKERIATFVKEGNFFARFGGDIFLIVTSDHKNIDSIRSFSRNILSSLIYPIKVKEGQIYPSASVGIAISNNREISPEELIRRGEAALHGAKVSGKKQIRIYESEENNELNIQYRMDHDLHRALDNQEFMLYYQPKVEVSSGKVIGAEALIRWNSPDRGLVSPAEFIPYAENSRIIHEIGKWVLKTACRDCRQINNGEYGIKISVNISARQFKEENFAQQMTEIFRDLECNPYNMELEITESSLIGDMESIIQELNALKFIGVSLSIDDFGKGYSSLAYIRQLPIDKIKIDKAFMDDVPDNKDGSALVSTIIAMAQNLNLEVIAEGVERETQLNFLKERGCHIVQGYYYSPPLSLEDFQAYLQKS